MSAKGLKCTVILLFVTANFINVTWSYQIGDYHPNYSYRSADNYHRSATDTTTECITAAPKTGGGDAAAPPSPEGAAAASTSAPAPAAPAGAPAAGAPAAGAPDATAMATGGIVTETPQSASNIKLRQLVQHIYAAQARVQLEANEIKKAQGVATSAQKALEEAANNVRVITAALQTAQQEVAAAAVRAQTAQLQLAAHDQLLFAARQKVDALSAQMVGLQAEDGVVAPKTVVNIDLLLSQLKAPLPQSQTPTSIPAVDNPPLGDAGKSGGDVKGRETKGLLGYDYYYMEM